MISLDVVTVMLHFISTGGLLAHKNAVHERVRYECSKCASKFTTRSQLNKHIKEV